MILNPRSPRWQGNEFFAFPGRQLGRKNQRAESFCSLPSRMAAWVGAQVGLHRSPTRSVRPGTDTIARPAIDSNPVILRQTLTNISGHSLREKADILNRDFVDFLLRY